MSIPNVTPELPARSWRLILSMLGRLPQGALSRAFGQVADLPIPRRLRPRVLTLFARSVGIDLSEVELPLEEYPTLNRFFVRRLRPGVRSWPEDQTLLASPVDGAMGQLGSIRDGRILHAKGRWYSAAELLGDSEEARRFEGGLFATLYLSPRDYHRIHAPTAGAIPRARYLPGALLPVNAPSVTHVPDLFSRNERLLCYLDSSRGRVAVVAVGAYNVGRISAAFDERWGGAGAGAWVTNLRGGQSELREYDPPVEIRMGAEIMAFHLGSTVVLLLEPGSWTLDPGLQAGQEVRLGQPLAR